MAFDETSRSPVSIPEDLKETLGRHWIYFIEPYVEDSIVIGAFGKGIYIYDFRSGKMECIYDGEFVSPFYKCKVDSQKNIWISDSKSEPFCI